MDDWTKGSSDRLRVDELRGTAQALGDDPQLAVDAAIIMIRCEGMTVAEACERVKSAKASGWRP